MSDTEKEKEANQLSNKTVEKFEDCINLTSVFKSN